MRRTLLLASLLLGCVGTAGAGQIYKWVDAQGVTHFTAQPPQDGEARVVPAAKQPPPPSPAATPAAESKQPSQAEIDERVRREVAQKEKERAEYCGKVRTNLAQLRNNPRLLMEVDGKMKRLTEEERQGRIAEAEKVIGESCE